MKVETTAYEVLSRGQIESTHTTESAAVRAAKKIGNGSDPSVRMVVESGTYKSWTTIWPEHGDTVSVQ